MDNIDEFSDEYVENYIKENKFDFVLTGTIITHYKWTKWFVNMTKMSDEEIMSAIKEGAEKLNQMLDLGLNEDTYIRTKGYKNRLGNLAKQRPKLDTKKIKRNINDMNFNYAQTDFKFEKQSNS